MTAAACASVWVLVASACACECLHALTETKIKCKSPAVSCFILGSERCCYKNGDKLHFSGSLAAARPNLRTTPLWGSKIVCYRPQTL